MISNILLTVWSVWFDFFSRENHIEINLFPPKQTMNKKAFLWKCCFLQREPLHFPLGFSPLLSPSVFRLRCQVWRFPSPSQPMSWRDPTKVPGSLVFNTKGRKIIFIIYKYFCNYSEAVHETKGKQTAVISISKNYKRKWILEKVLLKQRVE